MEMYSLTTEPHEASKLKGSSRGFRHMNFVSKLGKFRHRYQDCTLTFLVDASLGTYKHSNLALEKHFYFLCMYAYLGTDMWRSVMHN